jgi:hypothetical protein
VVKKVFPNTLGKAGEQYEPPVAPFARGRCPFSPFFRSYFPGAATRGSPSGQFSHFGPPPGIKHNFRPDFGFGVDPGRLCGYPRAHLTAPVRGGDQPRTTPMPIQRISTDFWGSPDHPRRAETAERATWGIKTPPRPPTAGTPPAPARVRRKPRRWDPLVPIWGGSPVAAPRPPAP